MKTILILLIVIAVMLVVVCIITKRCFDDNDPDMFWYDNYTVINCTHKNQSLVVVESTVTCETVHTVCNDCKEVLNIEIQC